MISQAERSNFLRQCWRTHRWKDGVGTLLLPLRMSLYKFRKDTLGRNKHNGNGSVSGQVVMQKKAPAFSSDVHPIFCNRPSNLQGPFRLETLFAEVDSQLLGTFRLAGGRSASIDEAAIESSKDPEDAHAYHRLYWAVRYAQAAAFGHARAGEGLLRGLTRYLDGRWESSDIAAWPYTAAERIGSLAATLFWIDCGRVPELLPLIAPIKTQIWKDGIRLSSNVEIGLGLHNHLLNDARGLFLAAAALHSECEQAAQWRQQALDLWDEYFPQLVLEDGTFGEQSSHYHLLLCRTALEYWLAARLSHRSLPAGFEQRLRSMFDLANELLRPDGSLARFGHNSPDRTISDLWGLLAAASHYELLRESPRHRAITPLTLFYCGTRPELAASATPSTSRLFPAGGFAILRSPELNAELTAHGDGRDTVGPHGDAGRGSYELWWNGQVLVREPGSYFSSSGTAAEFYQSAEAQNVTSLEGLSPAIAKSDARFLAAWYWPQGGVWKKVDEAELQFRCESFSRLQPDIILSRSWRLREPGTFTFKETVGGTGCVRFESRICLGDADWGPIERTGQDQLGSLHWRGSDGSSAKMTVKAPATMTLAESPCSFLPEYGVEKQGRLLLLTGFQQLPFCWTVEWKLREAA
jgi:hypothetical protein